MQLKNAKGEEFLLRYTTASYMNLKSILKCENLRKELLQAANTENLETFAKCLKEFSDGKLAKTPDAYPCIDAYKEENQVSAYEMFLEFVAEVGEAGFFKGRKTLEEIRQMAESPELEIDMGEITSEAVRLFKAEMLENLVRDMSASMTTGANTSTTSAAPLMSVA